MMAAMYLAGKKGVWKEFMILFVLTHKQNIVEIMKIASRMYESLSLLQPTGRRARVLEQGLRKADPVMNAPVCPARAAGSALFANLPSGRRGEARTKHREDDGS